MGGMQAGETVVYVVGKIDVGPHRMISLTSKITGMDPSDMNASFLKLVIILFYIIITQDTISCLLLHYLVNVTCKNTECDLPRAVVFHWQVRFDVALKNCMQTFVDN